MGSMFWRCSHSSVVYQSGNVGERREETEFGRRSSEYRQSSHQVLEEAAGWDVGWRCCFYCILVQMISFMLSWRRFRGEEEGRLPCEVFINLQRLWQQREKVCLTLMTSESSHLSKVVKVLFPLLSSSTKKSDECSGAPTDPGIPPPVPSFPPALITTGNVRNKSRELLVTALQTGGEQIIWTLILDPSFHLWSQTGLYRTAVDQLAATGFSGASHCLSMSPSYLDVFCFSCTSSTTW